jgi:outer membrane lipoprotein-sorting protein
MRTAIVVTCFCAAGLFTPRSSAETLEDVLSRMDKSSSSFRAMTAKIRKVSYTAVIKDLSEESGTIAMRTAKKGEMEVRVDFTAPDQKTWAFRGRKAELYVPKINTVQEYDLGKHARLLDQFLLLGFGSTSRDLRKNYSLNLLGSEQLQGKVLSRVELIPKSAEAQEHLKRVEIWVPQDAGYPVQQKFFQGSGDYVLVTYSDVKLEPTLTDTVVRLVLPKGVKREFPQK